MASELVYLRDLDGTGSMHVCASGDDGAIAYAPAATRPAPEYAGLVSWLTYESREAARKNYPEFSQKLNEAATALTALTERNKALEAEVARLRDWVELAGKQFAFYAENHLAKGTPDGNEKAATNQAWADVAAALLGDRP